MKTITPRDLDKIYTCDLCLVSINWVNDGKNIEVIFQVENGHQCLFLCTWASFLTISIKTQRNEGGFPLTWDIHLKEINENTLEVIFDFASKGEIRLECNELKYIDKI